MFVGHLAVALGAKKLEPRMPLWAGVGAAFGLDLIWPVLLLLGLETVRIDPGNTAFTSLDFVSYPWSHSLLLVLGWSGLVGAAALFGWKSRRVALTLAVLVFSHWALDWVTHRPDLPLWPGGPMAGLGLWNSIPGTFLVEGGLLVASLALFLSGSRPTSRAGTVALVSLLVLLVPIWAMQPWAPPAPNTSAVAFTTLALWLVPPWARWIESTRRWGSPGGSTPG